jgi:CBS domain-containing protein
MNVADIMTPGPTTIDQNQTLRAALEKMEALNCPIYPSPAWMVIWLAF